MANDIKLQPKEEGRRETLRGFAVGVKRACCNLQMSRHSESPRETLQSKTLATKDCIVEI